MSETDSAERGRSDGPEELRLRLPTASSDYLRGAAENPAMGPDETVLALRNRSLPVAVIQKLARDRRWVRVYEVKLGLAKHPRTPHAIARGLLGHIFWRDLMEISIDPRVAPPLKRDAERVLGVRLAELSLGEKVALARRAGPGVIAALRESPDVPVLRALFGNPRFVERDAIAVAAAGATPREALAALAAHGTWGARRPVRLAVLENPKTPVPAALRLVERLSREDLAGLGRNPSIPRIVRVGAERRLARSGFRPGDLGLG